MPERGPFMTATPPPGHSRAEPPLPVRQSNAVLSENHSPDDGAEQIPGPGHGAVAVFQAPQPVRPRANGGPAVDPMDIDSPFLDLFGGAPAAPAEPELPPDDPDADFDFGFDFDGADASRQTSAPPTESTSDLAEPAPGVNGNGQSPAVNGQGPAVNGHGGGISPESSIPPQADAPVSPFLRAPLGPQADFYDEREAPQSDFEDWPDEARPGAFPTAAAAPVAPPPTPTSAPPVQSPPLWQTIGTPGVTPMAAVEAYQPGAPDGVGTDLPAPRPA